MKRIEDETDDTGLFYDLWIWGMMLAVLATASAGAAWLWKHVLGL
jgi:hypothetical protein